MPSSLPSFIISTGLIFFDLPWSGTVCAFCLYLYYYQQQVGGFISTANCSTVQMDAIPFGATKTVCFKICHGNIITHLTSHPDIVPLLHLWKALIWENAKAKKKRIFPIWGQFRNLLKQSKSVGISEKTIVVTKN